MHRSLKPHAQAKKVPPPALPGDPQPAQQQHHYQHQYHQQIPLYRLGGSISSGAGRQLDDAIIMSSMVSSPSLEEGGFNLPRETSVALRIKDEITDYGGTNMSSSTGGNNNNSASSKPTGIAAGSVGIAPNSSGGINVNPLVVGCPPSIVPCPPPVFCATLREPLTHKAAVYYHQQLALQEDQGIDLTQSPGRDSPGSSSGSAGSGSRHSTASLDSGRASSYLTGVSGTSIRGSTGGSSSSGGGGCSGALSSPRCSSVSSSSIGSVDRVSQRNDELIVDWLLEMKYEEYAQLFIAAGYDLPTIARMTPEDLTAIGIKNPHHRERIKQRIDKLQVLDNLPHFVPGSIEEWLQLLRLEEYIQPLLDQNYKTVRDVTQVTWEDLEDIGIVKLGHQKKILLAIKRVKDIISGKWNPGGPNAYQQQEYRKTWQNTVEMPTAPPYLPTTRVSWDDSITYASSNSDAAYYCTGSNHECCNGNDVVLIKVRQPRGKSLESLEDIHDNSTRSHLTFSHYTTTDYGHFGHPAQLQQHQQQALHLHQQHQQQQHLHHQQQQQQQGALMGNRILSNAPGTMTWRRSYDDGDITPTNDAQRELVYDEGGGTLPRQQRNILQRAVLNSMPPLEHHHYMNAAAAAEYVCHAAAVAGGSGGVGGALVGGVPGVVDSSTLNAAYLTGSPMSSKKIAPEPPRRHCSIRNSRTIGADGAQIHQQQQQHQLQQQHLQQQHQQAHSVALHAGAQNIYYGSAGGVSGVIGGLHALHLGSNTAQYIPATNLQQQQPIYANYATIQQTTAEIHCEKFHDNKSNSSIDSIDTIPFANENTGTIKQRLLNRQDLLPLSSVVGSQQQQQQSMHLLSSSSSSSSSSTNTIAAANHAHSFHSLKSSSSLHDASLIRSDSIGSNVSVGSGGSSSILHLRSPTLQYTPSATVSAAAAGGDALATNACSSSVCGGGSGAIITTTVDLHTPSGCGGDTDVECTAVDAAGVASSGCSISGGGGGAAGSSTIVAPSGKTVSVNVLNDIGNMLANLTDELDAMLEEEKRVGLNIDSE